MSREEKRKKKEDSNIETDRKGRVRERGNELGSFKKEREVQGAEKKKRRLKKEGRAEGSKASEEKIYYK